ncbi:MAG TPA: alpha/beta hydrolase [Bacteroidales bacterium]|jgi:proline iminopeptidase|nr:alpha/beta hydrolase [Bacteroidales bacterium]
MPQGSENIVIQSGNASLSVTIFPRSDSETIILLHGGPGVPDDMTEVRDWLAQYFQVIYFDQRGTGKGVDQNCTFTINEYINDLNAIADYFKVGKFHLFGHSWGGVYAQLYATDYPEKILSLFLCSPASGTGKIWTMAEREIFFYNYKRSTFAEWLGMAANTVSGMMGNQKAYRNLFRQLIINYHKGYNVDPPDDEKLSRIGARAGTLTRREIKRYPELKPFSKTPYPVIITYGDNDAFGKSREYQLNRFPIASKSVIPYSGHTPWKHNFHAFQKVLRSFYL